MNWKEYVRWTDETVVNPHREKTELLEIWALGVGGEFCEFLEPALDWTDHGYCADMTEKEMGVLRAVVLEELGDLLYYIARLFVDTGSERTPRLGPKNATLGWVSRKVGLVIECVKKALRKEGRSGLLRLCFPSIDVVSVGVGIGLPGRREEFGILLDHAVQSIEDWLICHGSSLEEVCLTNQAKLLARKAQGTLAAQGKREGK